MPAKVHSPYEVLLKCWRFILSMDGLRICTPFFVLEILDHAPIPWNPDMLVTGIHLCWGILWSAGIENGQIMFREERWYRKSTLSLWEVRRYV